MAIPVARVHLAMAHAALPGLLPTPPKCMMMMMRPLLPTPPCAAIVVSSSPPKRPSGRADAAGRWDAHKVKPSGSPASPSSSGGRRSSDCERWDSDKNEKKIAAAVSSSASRTSSPGRSSSGSRADSEERWDARKKPAAVSLPSSSSSASSRRNKRRGSSKRRRNSRATTPAAAGRWDAHKTAMAPPRAEELDDGVSSTGSNDVESLVVDMPPPPPRPLPQRALFAGQGFIASPHPSMLPMPSSFMIRVA